MTRIDLESRLRRELVATTGRGEFDGADANVDGLTGEVLSLCIGVCKTEANRDTILWIVDSSLSPDLQQKNGIRISSISGIHPCECDPCADMDETIPLASDHRHAS